MTRTLVVSILSALLFATPAAAQDWERYEDMPPEWRNVIDALDAVDYYASPDDWKAYSVTMIWAMQAYGLSDLGGLDWWSAWHTLIAAENGSIEAETYDAYGAPSRDGCQKAQEKKQELNAIAWGLGTAAGLWRIGVGMLPGGNNPFLRGVTGRMNFAAGVLGLFAVQTAGFANSIGNCTWTD